MPGASPRHGRRTIDAGWTGVVPSRCRLSNFEDSDSERVHRGRQPWGGVSPLPQRSMAARVVLGLRQTAQTAWHAWCTARVPDGDETDATRASTKALMLTYLLASLISEPGLPLEISSFRIPSACERPKEHFSWIRGRSGSIQDGRGSASHGHSELPDAAQRDRRPPQATSTRVTTRTRGCRRRHRRPLPPRRPTPA